MTPTGGRAAPLLVARSRWPGLAACALVLAAVVGSSAIAFAAPPQTAAREGAAGDELYSIADTPIGVLLDDPAARAVLDKHIPAFTRSGRSEMTRDVSLKAIQGYALQLLTDEKLAAIEADLALLPPRPRLPGIARTTTDEAKVRPYTLPDPLVLADGRPVRDARTWWSQRRPEILAMFETLQFGRAPARPETQRFEVFDRGTPALHGKAIRRQVTIHLVRDPAAPRIHLVAYLPADAKRRVPLVLMPGFGAPSAMFDDPGLAAGTVWDAARKSRVPAIAPPGGPIDVVRFLDAGIGVAAFYYGDVEPDFAGGYPFGVRRLFGPADEASRPPTAWGAIAAWSWGLSRAMDYLVTDRAVDPRRVALVGASRLGKTVLWAAARDQRFAAVIACCSGKLGAGLMRRNFGAPVSGTHPGETDNWLAPAFAGYRGREETLPIDGHMLLSLIAPRPVLLQTGAYDHAADPKGEFLAAIAASPVYRLLSAEGLGAAEWPPAGPILTTLGYTMNPGGHGIAPGDWDIYLAFLKKHL